MIQVRRLLLQQCVEASIHLILHTSGRVYEQEIFERRRLFIVTIFRSRVELNDYIALVAEGASRELLERGEADAVVISIMGEPRDGSSAGSSAQEVLEQFRLSFHPPPPSQRHAIGSGVGGGAGLSSADLDALRAHLRGFLLKLHVCDTLLPPLPPCVCRSRASCAHGSDAIRAAADASTPPAMGRMRTSRWRLLRCKQRTRRAASNSDTAPSRSRSTMGQQSRSTR